MITEEPWSRTLTQTSLTMATSNIYDSFTSFKCPWQFFL